MSPACVMSPRVVSLLCALLAAGCAQQAPEGPSRGAGAPPAQPRDAQLHFAGDVYFGEAYRSALSSAPARQRYNGSLAALSAVLSSAPVVANLESALTSTRDSPLQPHKRYLHRSRPEPTASALARHGFVALNLANNHALDYGLDALAGTTATLQNHRLTPFGAGMTREEARAPFQIELPAAGRTVSLAVIGAYWYRQPYEAHYAFYANDRRGGVRQLDERDLTIQIRQLKGADPARQVVVFPHWGRNYHWRDEEQRRLAHALVDAGADMVIGHGAHVFQEIERYRGRWILYGLGNLVFLSPGRYEEYAHVPYSMLATLRLSTRRAGLRRELLLRFIASDNLQTRYRPYLLAGDAFSEAVDSLKQHSCTSSEALCALSALGHDRFGPYLRLPLDR